MKTLTTLSTLKLIAIFALAMPAGSVFAQSTVSSKADATSSRAQAKSKANQMATGIMAAESALTPDQIAIAERVHTGRIQCEFGNQVAVLADPKQPGYFTVTTGKQRYRMVPAATTTGAIRLEDKATGGVWLQIANKSMLLNEKQGQRLADECMSPPQKAVADALKANPAPSVLDAPK